MAGIHFDITGDNDNFLRKIREVEDGVRTASRQIGQSGLGIEDLFKRMKQAAAGFFTLRAASDFARKVANVRGEFQQLEVAFRTMLGSADKADALMSQLVKTAATTPFGLQDVAQGAKQLLAYGLEAEKVNGTLIRLGDIAAGLSIPLGDLVYLYGTTMAQGRLYTQDLNQFTGRGIPMIAELARQFGVAESEVKGLVEAGKVGFPEVQKVIESLTNEGGKFGGLMEAQSKTITGQISNIEDAISTMFNEIGQKSEGAINTALSGASYLVENYEKVGRMLLELVGTYGTYKTALMGLSAAENLRYQMTLAHMAGLTKMQAVMTVLREKAAGLANPYALAAAAIAGLAYGIYKLATYQTEAEKAQKKLNEATAAATGAAAIEQSELARLKGRLQACKEGTEEYGRVKEEIVKKFGQYDSGLKAETLTVQSLAEKYDGLTQAILKSYNARQYEKFSKEQAGEFEKTATKYYDRIFSILTKEYGDELGTQYGVELQRAISEGAVKVLQSNDFGGSYKISGLEKMVPKLKGVLLKSGYGPGLYYGRFARHIAQIVEAQETLQKTDELARRRFGIDGDATAGGTGRDKAAEPVESLSEAVEAARENVARLKKELSGLQSGKLPENAGKGFSWKTEIENKKKELDEAQKTLDTLLGTGPKPGKPDREAGKQVENRQKIADELLSLRRKNQQDEIDLMEEGAEKRLAQINLDYENETADILAKEKEWKEAQGGRLTQEQTEEIHAALATSYAKRGQSISGVNEERMEEEKRAMEEYLKEYGTFRERFKALKEEYDRKMSEAKNEGKRKSIEAEYAELLAGYELQASGFAKELAAMTADEASGMLEDAEKQLLAAQEAYDALDSSSSDEAKEYARRIAGLKAKINELKKALEGDGKTGGKANWAEAGAVFQAIANGAREAAGEIRGFDAGLADMLVTVSDITSGAGGMISAIKGIGEAANAAEKASGVLAAISAGIQAVSGLFGIFSGGESSMERTLRLFMELNDELARLKREAEIDSVEDTVFGTDVYRRASENMEVYAKALERYGQTLEKIRTRGAEISYGVSKLEKYGKTWESAEESIAEMLVQTRHSTWFRSAKYDTLKNQLPELFNDDGSLDMDALKEFQGNDLYGKLSEENRRLIDGLIGDWELYKEALDGVKSYLSDIFGDLGGTMTDALVDAFKNGTDAAEAFTESVSGMLEELAKNMIYSVTLAPLMEKAQQDMLDTMEDAGLTDEQKFDKYVEIIDALTGGILDRQDEFDRLLEKAKESGERHGIGLFGPDEGGESSRGASSKGIAAASQDSVDYMNGIFTNMQGHTFSINENVARIAEGMGAMAANNSCLAGIGKTMESLISMSGASLNYLAGIESHTAVLETMNENIRYLRSDVNDILLKGVKML